MPHVAIASVKHIDADNSESDSASKKRRFDAFLPFQLSIEEAIKTKLICDYRVFVPLSDEVGQLDQILTEIPGARELDIDKSWFGSS